MGNGYGNALEKPERHEPAFVICEAVVRESKGRALKDCLGIDEIDPVIPQVGQALGFVPAVLYLPSVYTGRGRCKRRPLQRRAK
jgi:hypothetical protein